MPRHKDVAMQNRNIRMAQMVAEGFGLQVVADEFGVSRARVSQIVSEYQSVISDDGTREILIAQLDSAKEKALEIMRAGQPLISSGTGKVVTYPDGHERAGEMVIDERVRLDAINVFVRVVERRAKISALDRARAKEKDESKEIGEAMAYLQELAREKQALQARVTQYEAVALPPHEYIQDADVVGELVPVKSLASSFLNIVLIRRPFPGENSRALNHGEKPGMLADGGSGLRGTGYAVP